MSSKLIRDRISMNDNISNSSKSRTLWAKTEVLFGYGLHKNEQGISELDETVFANSNMVPIGGVQYAMETLFGVKGEIPIPTLNNTLQIGAQNSTISPSGGMPYPYGQKVCLFGVGTGGAAENNVTVLDVNYSETGIEDMVPFRFTNEVLSDSDVNKYFGKKTVDGTVAYYLKAFDSLPTIHHLYKNGEEGEDGSEVDSSYLSSLTSVGVESFTEICLTITKKDIREWFAHNGNIEESRINTLALFTGVYDSTSKDYANIQLFSKLNIPTEPLSLTKDMNIIYRVYGA